MPRDSVILDAAGAVIAEQNVELNAIRARQLLAVGAKSATGSGNMNALFSLDVRFRLIFVRCHFTGTAGLAPLSIAIDSGESVRSEGAKPLPSSTRSCSSMIEAVSSPEQAPGPSAKSSRPTHRCSQSQGSRRRPSSGRVSRGSQERLR